MPLHPEAQAMLDLIQRTGRPPIHTMRVAEAREMYRNSGKILNPGTPLDLGELRDLEIPGPAGPIPARLYRPHEAARPTAATVFFHGGGWVIGDLDSHDAACRWLARESGAAVLAVDYRLAPEHPFPAGVEDCWAALVWAAGPGAAPLELDPARLAVAGDSAGGNLAIAVTRRARAAGGPALRHQVLIYPATDATMSLPSHQELGEGYVLTRAAMDWFWGHYGADRSHPEASPLTVEDLAGLPPTTVLIAGYDPLKDEGAAYAERLRAAGVETELLDFPGMMHGFITAPGWYSDARVALTRLGGRLKLALA